MKLFINDFFTFLIYPVVSSFLTWYFTKMYLRKSEKVSLEEKFEKRIEELSLKYLDLNEKYLLAMERIQEITRENKYLIEEIKRLKENTKA